jgi:hypothetical protein
MLAEASDRDRFDLLGVVPETRKAAGQFGVIARNASNQVRNSHAAALPPYSTQSACSESPIHFDTAHGLKGDGMARLSGTSRHELDLCSLRCSAGMLCPSDGVHDLPERHANAAI